MTDAISGELRGLAGPGLYRRNAFRLSGLTATVDRRSARQTMQRLRAALQVGADVDFGPTASRDPHELQAACDLILGDPRRRLVHELFAPWGKDVRSCGCSPSLHARHDNAVAQHARAIETEQANDDSRVAGLRQRNEYWSAAARDWGHVLAAEEFWSHLERRVAELDDRQLDQGALDAIEEELPRTLLKPLTDLAATIRPRGLVALARDWPAPDWLVTELHELTAEPLYEELEDRRARLSRRLGQESPDAIAAEIEDSLVPKLATLDALMPPERHHRTATLHDQFAILLNNCAVQLMDRGELTDDRAERWLATAATIAYDPREQALVADNQEALRTSAASIADFESQIYQIYNLRGRWAAETVLRQIRRENDSPAVRAEIDRMLREMADGSFARRQATRRWSGLQGSGQGGRGGGSRPTDRRGRSRPAGRGRGSKPPARRPATNYSVDRPRRRRGRRTLVWLLVIAALVFGWYRWAPLNGDKASVFESKAADNAEPGTCLDRQPDDWRDDATELLVRDCAEPHWAEVLGYVPLSSGPDQGADQTAALANFGCAELLAQQGLRPTEYLTDEVVNRDGNYASCVVRRKDGKDLSGGRKVKDGVKAVPKPVALELDSASVAENAPIGTCVQKQGAIGRSSNVEAVPIVRCDGWHWAEVFGYPVLYEAGSPRPKSEQEASAKARAACSRLVPSLPGFATTVGRPWAHDTIYTYCLVHRSDNKQFKGRLR